MVTHEFKIFESIGDALHCAAGQARRITPAAAGQLQQEVGTQAGQQRRIEALAKFASDGSRRGLQLVGSLVSNGSLYGLHAVHAVAQIVGI